MKLKILGSSSKGNCSILENNSSALIIEAGVSFKEIKKALDFDISKIKGCIISHSHNDHSKYAKDLILSGIEVYTSEDTAKEKFISSNFYHENKKFYVDDFLILPFKVVHDVTNHAFLIHHSDCGKVLFLTDSYYSPYVFNGLNNIIVEVNFSEEILNQNIVDNKIEPMLADRVRENHMSLEASKELLKSNDLTNVNNIVLTHLSDGNSNAKQFQEEIVKSTGKNIIVADKEIEIEFNKTL